VKAAKKTVRPTSTGKAVSRTVAKKNPAGRKTAAGKAPARKVVARKATSRKATPRKAAARKAVVQKPTARKAPPQRVATPAAKTPPAPVAAPKKPARAVAPKVPARKPPSLDRARRTVSEEDFLPFPPSSLDLDRTASAARTGRHEMNERYHEHTESSPALTGGDVDADWESAYAEGDEAPGGDNPTPDQDIVDDIGRALGVHYEDNEELKGEKKISDRDLHRWELDPASAEDYNEHEEDK
jgi:hypothetical protein